jgi:hypothetical protein
MRHQSGPRTGLRWRVWSLVVIALVVITAVFLARTEDLAVNTVNTSITGKIPPLSADLVPFISSTDVQMLLTRVDDVHLVEARDVDPPVERGRVTLEVLEGLSDSSVRAGARIVVPAQRIADPIVRVRNAFDQWNVLPLVRGDVLIVAVRPMASAGLSDAVAARQIGSPSAPEVQQIRQAYAIERFAGPPETKQAMLEAAIMGGDELLTEYGLDALQRRAVLGREAGARVIAAAIGAASVTPDARLQLAEGLTDLFDPERNADATNVLIVRTIAAALAAAPDSESRAAWASSLAAILLTEFTAKPEVDRQVRTTLIRKVDKPTAREMIAMLSAIAEQDPDDVQVRALLRAWRSAGIRR